MRFKGKVFTVNQINKYIKSLLEDDVILSDLFIEGEISNFKNHTSGHMYFTLKDTDASINCVIFKNYADEIMFAPENGMKVIVYGKISLYEKTGQYQLYAQFLEPSGKGALYVAFEQLKEKLSKEGLFDNAHKKPIPLFPSTIAVITSKTGAAIRDIIHVAKRRNKGVEIVVVNTLVQGENAGKSISDALDTVNKWGKADVIILGRGGGSIEDLWAFNEEIVARAIFKSKIPIISAVGHETDFTIADFVADLRAETPSAAAEIAVPSYFETKEKVDFLRSNLDYSINNIITTRRNILSKLINSRVLKNPLENVYNNQIYVENLVKKLNNEINYKLSQNRLILNNNIALLHNISPLTIINRGYALVYDEKGKVQTSVSSLSIAERIKIKFKDGFAEADICYIEEDTNG